MNQLVSEVISTIFQVGFFVLIPFIFYKLKKDRSQTFFRYIGFYKPPAKSLVYVVLITLIFLAAGIGLIFLDENVKQAALSPDSVGGKLRLMGLNPVTIITLLIIALVKTSLSEEILFRGFIAKRLVEKYGFKVGNFSQALIFGLLHLLLFSLLMKPAIVPLTFIFLISFLAAWVIGYVKEKQANGSIIPGWLAHGLANTISYFITAFLV